MVVVLKKEKDIKKQLLHVNKHVTEDKKGDVPFRSFFGEKEPI